MSEELIVVRQLPIIEEKLREVKQAIERRVSDALSLECTEETYKEVKKIRADLNKEFAVLEENRKTVKQAILKPYNDFEALYKECASDCYKNADSELKRRIEEVESGLKQQRRDKVGAYFDEYAISLGLESGFVSLDNAPINITLSQSFKSCQTQVRAFLDDIAKNVDLIEKLPDRDEVMALYKKDYNLTNALAAVEARRRAIEDEKKKREAQAAEKAAREAAAQRTANILEEQTVIPFAEPAIEPTAPPVAIPVAEKKFSTSFCVTGTLEQLKALKEFLTDGGYTYEQL